jgi:hypothetical protein
MEADEQLVASGSLQQFYQEPVQEVSTHEEESQHEYDEEEEQRYAMEPQEEGDGNQDEYGEEDP